jgi:hypothetical protein
MPCYEVRTMSVEFKAENSGLLDKAVKALGWEIQHSGKTAYVRTKTYDVFEINLQDGKARIREGMQGDLNALKRAYSMEAIKQAASAKKWAVKVGKTGLAGSIQKRSF